MNLKQSDYSLSDTSSRFDGIGSSSLACMLFGTLAGTGSCWEFSSLAPSWTAWDSSLLGLQAFFFGVGAHYNIVLLGHTRSASITPMSSCFVASGLRLFVFCKLWNYSKICWFFVMLRVLLFFTNLSNMMPLVLVFWTVLLADLMGTIIGLFRYGCYVWENGIACIISLA